MGRDASISWPALYRDRLLDANIENGLKGGPLANRDHRRVAEDGDQVALPAGFDAEHAEAVLVVVEGDALDEAGQDLRRTHRRCARHPGMIEIKILGRYRDQAGTARRAALTTVGRGPGRR